MLLILSLSKLL